MGKSCVNERCQLPRLITTAYCVLSHMLNVEYIYLHLPYISPSFVGKYAIHGASGYCLALEMLIPS